MRSKNERVIQQRDMPKKKEPSRYKLPGMDLIFVDEPYWLRCVIFILGLAGLIIVSLILRK